ncbi:MAG: aminopeptidase P family protein [Gammaproteobacteria bacterium]
MSEEQVAPQSKAASRQRLQALLAELARRGLDGFLVPRADEHQGEYVPPRAARLAWLTGFTGSAGLAVAYRRGSAIFVDGRYTLQAQDQVDTESFKPQHLVDHPPKRWLAETLQRGDKIGYDSWLHTPDSVESLRAACAKAGAELIACADNPLDAIWTDQPAPPLAPVAPQPLEYAGETAAAKRERIGKALLNEGVDATVLTQPDSIAWLLNIRGGDVEHSPLPLSFATLHADGHVDLFIDERKLGAGVREHLGNRVTVYPPDQLGARLDSLGQAGKAVLADPKSAAAWIFNRLAATGAKIIQGNDPCVLPKALKNAAELAGLRAAHRRDGVALSRFLHWLDEHAASGLVDELGAAERLREFREASSTLKDLSFATISGAAANGAIVHYRSTAATNRKLVPGTLYLVDSGGQYLDGTTDVTRTIAIRTPTAEHRDRFTRVLKGHITLAMARFPKGTTGSQLDVLARYALWQAGLDYDHGTGHGVGSYLCVHEGPHRISKIHNDVALQPGMVVSNEPGYYKTGEYGIRIENLVVVTEAQDIPGGERSMHGFETLTLAPIDLNLVERTLLTDAEATWLNAFHTGVYETVGPALGGETQAWLERATRSI